MVTKIEKTVTLKKLSLTKEAIACSMSESWREFC